MYAKKYRIYLILLISIIFYGGIILWENNYYITLQKTLIDNMSSPGFISTSSDRYRNFIDQSLTITWYDKSISVPSSDKYNWIESYFRVFTQKFEYRANTDAIISYLQDVATSVNRQPINGRYLMRSGVLVEYVPAVSGLELNIKDSLSNIIKAINNKKFIVELATIAIEPKINLEKLNELGINKLIGTGTSNFAGSNNERVYNIKLGAQKLNGLLIAPNEEISFNDNVGPITSSAGYASGLAIIGDKLIPVAGGGICQVSTTLFRTAIDAGLEIIERRGHALPVSYYNPQGFDATIFEGVVDLKFKNNTNSYMFIQSRIIDSDITFDIYGKDDGRKVVYNKPVVYANDEIGGFKTVFTRIVSMPDGTEFKDSFYTSYRSPSKFEILRNPLQ